MRSAIAFLAGAVMAALLMITLGSSAPPPQASFICSGSGNGYADGTSKKPSLQGLTEKYDVDLYVDLDIRLTCN